MPLLSDIRLPGREVKKPKTVHQLEPAESSFLDKSNNRAKEKEVIIYSDDSQEQVRRAQAGKDPCDQYNFKLLHIMLQGAPGYKGVL